VYASATVIENIRRDRLARLHQIVQITRQELYKELEIEAVIGGMAMNNKLPWVLLVGVGGYALLRHVGTRGGVTDTEADAILPGDEIIPHPMLETNHAISIAAPPAVVWRWLIQAGYRGAGRAGWYSDSGFDWLAEKLFFRLTVPSKHRNVQPLLHSANELLPAFQHTAVGDIVPDGPDSSPFFVVKTVQPERAWVLYSDTHLNYLSPTVLHNTPLASSGEFTWVFVLNPQGEQGTRLILRTRTRYGPPLMRYLALPLLYLGEAIFPRLILRGIKQRAEQQVEDLLAHAAS
jgi:hypothetical protein